jgi:HAD superfamily hydrolase (TIGR01450 family)
MRIAFITNNASRPPSEVAEHLAELGVEASVADVVTSAQAAARLLSDRLGSGADVAVLGGAGLLEALAERGLEPVSVDDPAAAALVTGYGPDVPWRDVMRAAVLVREGLWWVAANTDMTIPTPFGIAPGHGVQVEMLRRFTGVDPVIAGKPARPLFDETVRRVGGERPLMVGDRLDTDIEGARAAGYDSLLVMTGVTGLAELVAARPELRPTYLAADLAGLDEPQPLVRLEGGTATLNGWVAGSDGSSLRVEGKGRPDDWWRVVACAAWAHLDRSGRAIDVGDLRPPG